MRNRILCVMLLLLSGSSYADEKPIRFGLFPYVNPAKLVEHHQGLMQHLQVASGHRIQLLTSPDFKTFLQRTRDNEFDIILTAPHFGRLAEIENGYQRIAMTEHEVQGIYIVSADSAIQNLSDIKGKHITIAEPTSLIYRLAKHQLQEDYGLQDGKDIYIVATGTHNNAMYAVIKGESEVGVTGITLYQGLLKERGPIVRKIGETIAVPGFMLMANKDVSPALVQTFRQAALSYSSTESGKGYIFHGYKEINDTTMKMLDSYTSGFN